MAAPTIDKQLGERLASVLAAGPPIRLAVLFGSRARGTARETSDVDVGILPADPNLGFADELDLQARLSAACARSVDLVRLDHASTVLKWEVIQKGVVLLASTPTDWSRFRAAAASEYLDFAPAFLRAAERFRHKLASLGQQT